MMILLLSDDDDWLNLNLSRFCEHHKTSTMRWLKRSPEPQLLGLSPLKTEDATTASTFSINSTDQIQSKPTSVADVFRNQTPHQSARKSRIGENSFDSFRLSTFYLNFEESKRFGKAETLRNSIKLNQRRISRQPQWSFSWNRLRDKTRKIFMGIIRNPSHFHDNFAQSSSEFHHVQLVVT